MSRIRRTTRVHAPLTAVYELVRDPRHWARWWPGSTAPQLVYGAGEVGTRATFEWQAEDADPHVHLLHVEVIQDYLHVDRASWKARLNGALDGELHLTLVPSAGSVDIALEIHAALGDDVIQGHGLWRSLEVLERSVEQALNDLRVPLDVTTHHGFEERP
jgi:uncharacterized protein YndB with AHSA1/START domain